MQKELYENIRLKTIQDQKLGNISLSDIKPINNLNINITIKKEKELRLNYIKKRSIYQTIKYNPMRLFKEYKEAGTSKDVSSLIITKLYSSISKWIKARCFVIKNCIEIGESIKIEHSSVLFDYSLNITSDEVESGLLADILILINEIIN